MIAPFSYQTLDYSPYSAPLITPHSLRVAASSSSLPSSQVLIYDPQTGDFRLYLIYVPVGSDIETPIKFEGDSAAILTVLQGKAHVRTSELRLKCTTWFVQSDPSFVLLNIFLTVD